MPFYGDSSDFKLAGTRIVLAELVIPSVLFIISSVFLTSWALLLGITPLDLIDLNKTDYVIVIPELVMIYSFFDLLLACFLYSAVIKLKWSMCLAWIILQVILLLVFTLPCFICPFFALGLSLIFWKWILVCIFVYLYKIYRIRIICFLMNEMKEEGRVWKNDILYE